MSDVYKMMVAFKKKYPMTIGWRLKQHAKVIDTHLNPDEKVTFAFAAQKNNNPLDIITTYAVVLTNKRILLAQKRLIFGYFFKAITPDMFNDLSVKMGIIWGRVIIDTVKETVFLTNIQREALDEIETAITHYMIEEKKHFIKQEEV